MLIFSMGVSLDGYVAGPGGDIDWAAPDAELHQFHNDQTRELAGHFCGRALYENMRFWEQPRELDAVGREFAAIWQALPKVVFSTTLDSVEGNARLATGSLVEEAARVAADAVVSVGGAGLAGAFARLDLIDEYRLFV